MAGKPPRKLDANGCQPFLGKRMKPRLPFLRSSISPWAHTCGRRLSSHCYFNTISMVIIARSGRSWSCHTRAVSA
eukprot:365445-Chlamydomonas_euryale.AAC.1